MSQYNALTNLISSKSPILPTSVPSHDFFDNFSTSSKISGSLGSGKIYDSARKCVLNSRNNSQTYLGMGFASLAGWDNSCSGTGSATCLNNSSNDPDLAHYVLMATGGTTGSVCRIDKDPVMTGIGGNFGFEMIYQLTQVGTNTQDSLQLIIQTGSNHKVINLLINDGQIVIQNSANNYPALCNIDSTGLTRLWVEVLDNGNGTHTLTPYQDYIALTPVTITLPTGTSVDGRCTIIQHCDAHNNRTSQIYRLNVGSSQIQNAMVLFGANFLATGPASVINITLLVEDLDGGIDREDEILRLSKDGFSTGQSITITDNGQIANGVVKSSKAIHMLTGSWATSIALNNPIAYEFVNPSYCVVHGVYLEIV